MAGWIHGGWRAGWPAAQARSVVGNALHTGSLSAVVRGRIDGTSRDWAEGSKGPAAVPGYLWRWCPGRGKRAGKAGHRTPCQVSCAATPWAFWIGMPAGLLKNATGRPGETRVRRSGPSSGTMPPHRVFAPPCPARERARPSSAVRSWAACGSIIRSSRVGGTEKDARNETGLVSCPFSWSFLATNRWISRPLKTAARGLDTRREGVRITDARGGAGSRSRSMAPVRAP
jgi:hypothetical protein